ncbi:hypothetical protein ABI59_06265 [Acidobacteria bacterium Mor1]|nr:hypothetical protein ABI59_06265 [Acidobacteria bacterium Mor1]
MKRTIESEKTEPVPVPQAAPVPPTLRRRSRIVAGRREDRPERPGAVRGMRGLFVIAARRSRPTSVQES